MRIHEKNRYQETRWSITRITAELPTTTTSTLHVREQDRKDQCSLPTLLLFQQRAGRKRLEHVYTPQSNGVVERLNRKIVTFLRALISPHSITWNTWIPYVKCALNIQMNTATRETPHYTIFGEHKTLPYDLLNSEPRTVYNADDYIKDRIQKFQVIHQRVRNHMK